MVGISLSLVFLFSGAEAAPADNSLCQPLFFSSNLNPHTLIDINSIAFICAASSKSTTDKNTKTTTTTDTKDTKVKSDKKILSDQKNSTSRRKANIDD